MGRNSGRTAQLWSRNQKNFTPRFPDIAKELVELPSDTVIDGEIVALGENGKPSFDLLQGFGRGAPSIVLYAFDLLMLRGKDVRLWPLQERREQLRQIVEHLPDAVRYSETFDVPLPDLMLAVRQHQPDHGGGSTAVADDLRDRAQQAGAVGMGSPGRLDRTQ